MLEASAVRLLLAVRCLDLCHIYVDVVALRWKQRR